MKRNFGTLTLLAIILMAAAIGCDRTNREVIPIGPAPADEMMPMVPADDEESSVRYGLADTYDQVRNGARLVISYDAAMDAFTGNVTNTTNGLLTQVRVEVHLYDGTITVDELGPMLTPNVPNIDLMPGESHAITLPAMGNVFTEWVAHPEVGPMSGGGEGGAEGGGEHGAGAGGEGGIEGAEDAGGGEGGAEGAEGGGEHGAGAGGEGPEGGGN